MKSMTMGDFVALVQEDGEWLGGATLAREIAFHIPDSESIAGWLWMERRKATSWDSCKEESGQLAILGERHFLLVQVTEKNDAAYVSVESTPLGRLRSVRTYSHGEENGGGFTLDFAGPVFEGHSGSEIRYSSDRNWPAEGVAEFLSAVARVRR